MLFASSLQAVQQWVWGHTRHLFVLVSKLSVGVLLHESVGLRFKLRCCGKRMAVCIVDGHHSIPCTAAELLRRQVCSGQLLVPHSR